MMRRKASDNDLNVSVHCREELWYQVVHDVNNGDDDDGIDLVVVSVSSKNKRRDVRGEGCRVRWDRFPALVAVKYGSLMSVENKKS